MGKKIATCSYCGARAALVFDDGLHELTCGACGAPLHDMKPLRLDGDRSAAKAKGYRAEKYNAEKYRAEKARATQPEAEKSKPRDFGRKARRAWPAKKHRKSKKKPLARRMFEELWDVVEDIID